MVTPPLDARARRDGLNVIYQLDDLNLPAIYSSLFTSNRLLKERPEVVQKFVAGHGGSGSFRRKEPGTGQSVGGKSFGDQGYRIAAVGLRCLCQTADQSPRHYSLHPGSPIPSTPPVRRVSYVHRKPSETYDNSFAENLAKSGFSKISGVVKFRENPGLAVEFHGQNGRSWTPLWQSRSNPCRFDN